MAFNFKFQSILDLKIRLEDQKKSKYGENKQNETRRADKLCFNETIK